MGMDDDIVDDFMARVYEWIPADRALVIERELRQYWGASKVYVRKSPTSTKASIISQHLDSGLPKQAAFSAAGCKRRRGYMIIAQRMLRK